MSTLILNRREVEDLLDMPTCIGLMREALASLARGEVQLPLRPVLRIPDGNAFALMPAYSSALGAMGAKLITVYPGNHGSALDSHQGIVVLFDGTNGSVRAIMDASSITAIRTAAVSAVATNLLAREDVTTLAVLGSGVQAYTHLDAMFAVRRFSAVRIWSRTPDHARSAAAWARERLGVDATAPRDVRSAVEGADVVCTVTASREPVLRGEWLSRGAHVNAVGASMPTARELDTEAVRRAVLFVDRRESALNEAGDVLIPISEGAFDGTHIVGEIGQLLTGAVGGRRHREEITLFKSLGLAIEDLACAAFLDERARAAKKGAIVDLVGPRRA